MGFSSKDIDANKVVKAITDGKIKGIVILAGCNNVKFTQDHEMVSIARELLNKDVLCISEGCASVGLAKFGLLNPKQREASCGKGLSTLLSSLGKNVPAVVDLGSCENSGVTDFLISLSGAAKKSLKELPSLPAFLRPTEQKRWPGRLGRWPWGFLPIFAVSSGNG